MQKEFLRKFTGKVLGETHGRISQEIPGNKSVFVVVWFCSLCDHPMFVDFTKEKKSL